MVDTLFNFADENGDGFVSFQEFMNATSNLPIDFNFNSLDTHGTGFVTLQDFMNTTSNLPVNFDFDTLSNEDGLLSVVDCNKLFSNSPIDFDFSAADKEHTGFLSVDEFMNATADLSHINLIGHEIIDFSDISFGGYGSCGYTYTSSEISCLCRNCSMS